MSLKPITEIEANPILFGLPRWRTLAGWLIALGAVAGCAALFFFPPPSLRISVLCALGLASLILAGSVVALWDETVELNLRSGKSFFRRGIRLFSKSSENDLSEFRLLELSVRERPNLYGESVPSYSLALQGEAKTIPLFRNWGGAAAAEFAAALSGRLGMPIQHVTAILEIGPSSSKRSAVPLTAAIWLCLFGMVGVIFWPVVSGRAALRIQVPSLGSSSGGRRGSAASASDPLSLGTRAVLEGRYEDAERFLITAIEMQMDPPSAFNMIAYAYAGQGRLKEAMTAAKRALELAPNSWLILDTVGEMHERLKEYRPAEIFYAKALDKAQGQDTIETHAKFGRTLLALHKKSQAIAHLRIAATSSARPWGPMARDLLQENGVKDLPRVKQIPPMLGGRMRAF